MLDKRQGGTTLTFIASRYNLINLRALLVKHPLLVPLVGFEPTALPLESAVSIQLNYRGEFFSRLNKSFGEV